MLSSSCKQPWARMHIQCKSIYCSWTRCLYCTAACTCTAAWHWCQQNALPNVSSLHAAALACFAAVPIIIDYIYKLRRSCMIRRDTICNFWWPPQKVAGHANSWRGLWPREVPLGLLRPIASARERHDTGRGGGGLKRRLFTREGSSQERSLHKEKALHKRYSLGPPACGSATARPKEKINNNDFE